MNIRKYKGERGSVLVMAVVLSFAMVLLGLSYLGFVNRVMMETEEMLADEQHRFARYAGIMTADLYARISTPGSNYHGGVTEFYDGVYYDSHILFSGFEGGFYRTDANYTLVGTGIVRRHSGVNRQSESYRSIKLETFADYLYLSDIERDLVRNVIIRFWTPDTLDGKVHSNDTLHVMGSPRFMKKVTTGAIIEPPNNNARFDESYDLNARKIIFPEQADSIRFYTGYHGWGTSDPDSATEITFSGHNIYRRYCGLYINPPDTIIQCFPPFIASAPVFPIPRSGALFIEGKVYIKANRAGVDLMDGNFRSIGYEGRLTVASSDTMIIYDNLIYRYANPDNSVPETIAEIRDVLGLISENFIMVGDSVDDVVYINAAMAALNGSISVQDIYDYWVDNEKQSLFIYGSLAQKYRGIVHTTDYGDRGFIEKDYHYDKRLRQYPPPHFIPTGNNKAIYSEAFFDEG
ncbi:MAG: hypothetical protein V3S06_00660 [candidate division Zixibacteria bacterium]